MHMKARLSAAALVLLAPLLAVAADDKPALEPGFTSLFNGKDLDGWHVMNNGQFSVKEGVVFLDKGSGWLRSDKEYKDFELRLDFRFLNKGANSGIFFRASKDGANWPAKNYQVQTMDDNSIASVFVAGGLPKMKETKDVAKLKKVMKPAGEWQSYLITVRGPHVEVKLND